MTTTPGDVLREALAVLIEPGSLDGDAILDVVAALGDAQAVLDAVKVHVAGELNARLLAGAPTDPVRRAGHSNVPAFLAEHWRVSIGTARQYCSVGEGSRQRLSLIGEPLPSRFPALEAALAATMDASMTESTDVLSPRPAWVSIEQAAVIVRELTKASAGCAADELAAAERILVDHAPALTVPELRALAAHVRDRLDEDGVEPRETRQRRRRSLTITTTADGMIRVDWLLDPESAAYVVTAIDAGITRHLRRVRFGGAASEPAADGVSGHRFMADVDADRPADTDRSADTDLRTLAQLRCDTAVEHFRHLAGCDSGPADGPSPVAVVVRIDLDALQSGLGAAEIDGIATPVSAGTVRRMAADADIIPVVLGGRSEVLDLGRARRLFSRAQRLALAERDGGCAWPGCPHPPSYTEAHHIRWWEAHSGRTDLSNGVLLCSSHHHRVHDDGWQIVVRDGRPSFIPPPHIDPMRRPRPGGRITLRTAA